MKIDDLVEIVNHFEACRYMIETLILCTVHSDTLLLRIEYAPVIVHDYRSAVYIVFVNLTLSPNAAAFDLKFQDQLIYSI